MEGGKEGWIDGWMEGETRNEQRFKGKAKQKSTRPESAGTKTRNPNGVSPWNKEAILLASEVSVSPALRLRQLRFILALCFPLPHSFPLFSPFPSFLHCSLQFDFVFYVFRPSFLLSPFPFIHYLFLFLFSSLILPLYNSSLVIPPFPHSVTASPPTLPSICDSCHSDCLAIPAEALLLSAPLTWSRHLSCAAVNGTMAIIIKIIQLRSK